jgi:hypothetical protein
MVGRVAVQRLELPEVNETVPVAPLGSPLAASVALVPNETLDGVALAVNDVLAGVTFSDVVAVELASSASPAYVAVMGYVPPASVADVVHLVDGWGATQSVEPPDANVTVPVEAFGRPLSDSIEVLPKGTLDGVALAVNDVGAGDTVSVVVAVEAA